MINIKFDPRKLNNSLKQFLEAKKTAIRKQVADSGFNIEADAKRAVPVFEGALRASLNTKLRDSGYTARIGSGVLGGEALVYAEAIEFGRKPGGFPPYKEDSSLYRWVKLKLGIAGRMTKSVAFLIARKIAKEGFPAHPYLKPAYRNESPVFSRKIKAILKKVR